jgi:hypothetical protein
MIKNLIEYFRYKPLWHRQECYKEMYAKYLGDYFCAMISFYTEGYYEFEIFLNKSLKQYDITTNHRYKTVYENGFYNVSYHNKDIVFKQKYKIENIGEFDNLFNQFETDIGNYIKKYKIEQI